MIFGGDVRDGAILVVCTGNVCRSPYVERRLHTALKETDIRVSSAGTDAPVGRDMEFRIAARLRQCGSSADGFASKRLTSELIRDADMVLCATRRHRTDVVRMEPSALRRTYALADFSDIATQLVATRMVDSGPGEAQSGNFVRRVVAASARARSRVQVRSDADAEIVDPYHGRDQIFERMFNQIEQLLPPIISVLTGPVSRHAA